MYFADKEQAPQVACCLGNAGGVEDIAFGKEQFAANDLFVGALETVDNNAVDAWEIILGVRISGYGQKTVSRKIQPSGGDCRATWAGDRVQVGGYLNRYSASLSNHSLSKKRAEES